MKVVIFAGGKGTRIAEESHLKPKPMIEIGGKPILWHIMKIYAAQGFNDFIICLGYRGYQIKEYFFNYFLHNSDVSINIKDNSLKVINAASEDMKISMIDTGLETMTAGRLKRVLPFTENKPFMLTYGDGVADIDLNNLLSFHNKHGKLCTLTAIQPTSRFGVLNIISDQVHAFAEKPEDNGTWINGGFFVINPGITAYLKNNSDEIMWERQPLDDLTKHQQLMAYKHHGFWKCMDTMRDKEELEELWYNDPKWKKW